MPQAGGRVQRQCIGAGAEAGDGAARDRGNPALVAEGLAGVGVGEMDLDDRDLDALDGVVEGNGGVGERAGVEEDGEAAARGGLVQPVDEMAFVVGLAQVYAQAKGQGLVGEGIRDAVEGVMAVDLRLAGAEQVEVGAVQDHDEVVIHGRMVTAGACPRQWGRAKEGA